MKTRAAAVTWKGRFSFKPQPVQPVMQLQQYCQSRRVFGCTVAAASSVCRSDITSLILSVLGRKMVSGRPGLKVSHKPLVILVKLSHQNNFPHIHSRAMRFNWCQLPREHEHTTSLERGSSFFTRPSDTDHTSHGSCLSRNGWTC